jgi:AcrR family transcriptional regulator
MEVNRRTQADRSAATRAALVDAARPLFAEQGFAAVGTEAIVRAAGVTRGALYHQFADKTELFAAVVEAVEQDVMGQIMRELGAEAGAATDPDPLDELVRGASAWLDACAEPSVQQILLLDAPAVLGWERYREIGTRYSVGVVEAVLAEAVRIGRIADQPVSPLAHIIVGALDEGALMIARADDQAIAREQVRDALEQLIGGLAVEAP